MDSPGDSSSTTTGLGKLGAFGVGQIIAAAIVQTADTYLPKPLPNIAAEALAFVITGLLVYFVPHRLLAKRGNP